MQIITAIDNNPHYQNHLKAFLMSMNDNSPGQTVKVCLMDCDKEYGESLKRICDVDVVHISTDPSQTAFQRNYIRHYMTRDGFNNGFKKVAWIDNDALIRGDLRNEFWDDVVPGSIKVWARKKKRDKYKFQGGVYILGKSEKTKAYVDSIITALEKTDNWMLPQILLYNMCESHGIRHIQMDQKFNDSRFKDDSVIWHCKQTHFKETEFQEEFQYYLGKASRL